mmetsp:Transcript_118898/g.343915  ORF Transcript_118898/g.343915 Transcript_118898/m.343915 type:complete len:229 (+) Transcript_118898:8-694(+)
MLASAPYSWCTCSKIGTPLAELQSPKLQRKVVNMDRGTLLKNSNTFSFSLLPNASRNNKLTIYTVKKNSTIDQAKVVMPPIMPCIIDNRSLKTSVLSKRSTRANLSNRINRKSDAEGRSPSSFSATSETARMSCTRSTNTRNVSRVFKTRPGPQYCNRKPFIQSFSATSEKKTTEKNTSAASQPAELSFMSMLKPTKMALIKMTTPMMESNRSSAAEGSLAMLRIISL